MPDLEGSGDHSRGPPPAAIAWHNYALTTMRAHPLATVVLSLAVTHCSGAARRPTATALVASSPPLVTPARVVEGRCLYESRQPTATGASLAIERRPARYVEVHALGTDGATLAHISADATGSFRLEAPAGTTQVAVRAVIVHDGLDVRVTPDPEGRVMHERRTAFGPGANLRMEILADDAAPDGMAGALHIADTVLRGLEAAKRWTGRTLPPLSVYWGRGVTTEWSFFRGERPAGSGRYLLELLGGERGRRGSTDTDEHDEGIILHEVGHFVMDRLSSNSSTGGSHPSGYLIDPGLAWEEGRATWFSSVVRADPRYQDTIGLEPRGSLRVDHDIERGVAGPRGIGSEASVAQILWDLSDGVEGQTDLDHDGVALGPEAVLRAMMRFADDPSAYPSVGGFLRLASGGATPLVSRDALRAMLTATGEPPAMVPSTDDEDWPTAIALPGSTRGKIDGRTNPSPSGGPPRPENGFDALRVYRLRVVSRQWVFLELAIDGTGRPADHTDVDMELRDHRGEVISAARGEGAREAIGRPLDPGYYYVYVRDGGGGNRASYVLTTRARTLGPTVPTTPVGVSGSAP